MYKTKEEVLSYPDLLWLKSWMNSNPSELVLIFGSFIQKKENARDIDILVVSDVFEGSYYHMRRDIFKIPRNTKQFIDVFCYTLKEFYSLFPRNHPLLMNILHNTVILSGDKNVIERYQ